MKTYNDIPSEETKTASLKYRKYINKIICRWSMYFITYFLTIFLLMSVSPANASTCSAKNKKSICRAKWTSFSYPVILTGKNKAMVSNKNHKKSRARNYSFPV